MHLVQSERPVNNMKNMNVMIVGVGGQGTLLASRVLGTVAMLSGKDVKVSEVHGMSQRGGSVVTYVKIGDKVDSPLIEEGEADVVLAFETLEALRWEKYLSESGSLIVNSQEIDPMPVIIGAAKYPENILGGIEKSFEGTGKSLVAVDALAIARECGNIKAVNTVLIGLLAAKTDIDKDIWLKALNEVVPAKFLDLNINAFEAGYSL